MKFYTHSIRIEDRISSMCTGVAVWPTLVIFRTPSFASISNIQCSLVFYFATMYLLFGENRISFKQTNAFMKLWKFIVSIIYLFCFSQKNFFCFVLLLSFFVSNWHLFRWRISKLARVLYSTQSVKSKFRIV